ncbi:hypothetical protein AAF712_008876 [Marasmius tenuissimus]|uniref:F-box domain-containing protein n=1 Tax=Marasmius tenuissimus TaxID=585030 RepID=A0ABR2ZSX3_9AGAR
MEKTLESLLSRFIRPPEQFQQLFRHPILDHNRMELLDYLRDAEQHHKECKAEIKKYNALLLMLESRTEGMEKTIEKYRSLLSPIHRLPSDVLLEIFKPYCRVNNLDGKAMPPTLTLSMVCGRWWEVVLASPSLWTCILISLHYRNDKDERERRERIITNSSDQKQRL